MTTDTPSAEALAKCIEQRVQLNWTHATGEIPQARGYAPDRECVQAAIMLRSLASERDALRAALDAAQAPRDVPRLAEPVIAAAWRLACGPERPTAAMVEAYARDIESRVRELCGVAP